MDLAAIPFAETRHRGVAIHFLHSDGASGRAVVLIRMDPGCGYPRHTHRGFEEVFVLSGGYRDELGIWNAGAFVRYEDGTTHAPVALPGTEPCVLYATSERGIDLLDE